MVEKDKIKGNGKTKSEILEPEEIKLKEELEEMPKEKAPKEEKPTEKVPKKEKPKEEEIKKEEPKEEPAEFEDLEIVSEKMFTINLGRVWIAKPKRRAPRAINTVKEYMKRHMKSDDIVITNEINEQIWSKGIGKPPRRIKVRAVKDNENRVIVFPIKG
ncbi:MAG: 60S ribosomal protein L31 [Candidatus Bathyarchaeota archaeon]|nr:60S ribosomal protein L31 [Candidatus Bathyarchaeota archaeon]